MVTPTTYSVQRRSPWRGALAAAVLSYCSVQNAYSEPSASASTLAPTEVRDLPYGHALYYFFQEKYFSSATELLVDLEKHRLPHHNDEAQLLLGGMYLSYGLFSEAEKIFETLLNKLTPTDVANRAWFYLGQIYYQREQLDAALRALDHIKGALPGDFEPQKALLLANIQMRHEQYKEAIDTLSPIKDDSIWSSYAHYNLGIAYIKAKQVDKGKQHLTLLARLPNTSDEVNALKDKANLALGFAALTTENWDDARAAFRRMRLQGPASNAGLYGIGRAYFSLKNYHEALVYWTELANRNTRGAAVFEAQLSVPQAYGLLELYPQALDAFERAIASFQEATTQLDASIAEIRRVDIFENMSKQDVASELDWFWQPDKLPDNLRQHYITELYASHEFNEALHSYRDLLFYRSHLQRWLGNMDSFDMMLATRSKAFAERLPNVAKQYANLKPEILQQQHDTFANDVNNAAANNSVFVFANAKEQQQLEKLAALHKRIESIAGQADSATLDAMRSKINLLEGRIQWELSDDFKARAQITRTHLAELHREVDQAIERQTALQAAQVKAPLELKEFAGRIKDGRGRIQDLLKQVSATIADQQKVLRELAVQRLEQQKKRLTNYIAEAQLASAQIYDLISSKEQSKPAKADASANPQAR